MKRLPLLSLWIATSLLLGACSSVAVRTENDAVMEMLQQYGTLAALPLEAQQQEYAAAVAAFEGQPGDVQRLRLALMLSLPRAPWRDDARVLQLVESIAENPVAHESPQRDLATLIHRQTLERLRLLREEQARAEAFQSKLQGALADRQRQLAEEQRRASDLQHKLDKLLVIDRTSRRRMLNQ